MKLNQIGIPLDWEMVLTPRPDQIEDFNALIQWDKSANYSQVGTGKSLVSYLYLMRKLTEGKRCIVMMPPTLVPQYIRNFGLFLPALAEHGYTLAMLDKDRAQRHSIMDEWDKTGWPDILFMSYDLYRKYSRTLQGVRDYKVIVADEAHILSNASNKTFQNVFMHVYARNMDLLLMTATPTTTELVSAYGQIRLRMPQAYTSLSQFERMHCVFAHRELTSGRKVKQIVGYNDIAGINKHLMHQAVRRRARDVLPLDKPTIIDHTVLMHPKHAELYRRLLEEWMLEMGDELIVARNKQALRQAALQIITNVHKYSLVDDNIPDNPMETLLEIISSVNLEETKFLIFCNFQDTVRKLSHELARYNPALVYGGSNTQKEVDKLLNDPTCRVGVLNFQSGGAGLNLQGVAHHICVYEAIGSPGMLEQAIGRVHRGGQENPVIVWIFRYCRTLSNALLDKNIRRAGEIKESLEDSECFVDFLVPDREVDIRKELGL